MDKHSAGSLSPVHPDWRRRSWLIEFLFGFVGAAALFGAIMLGEKHPLGVILFIATLPAGFIIEWQLEKRLPAFKASWFCKGVGAAVFLVALGVIHPSPWRTDPPKHHQTTRGR